MSDASGVFKVDKEKNEKIDLEVLGSEATLVKLL